MPQHFMERTFYPFILCAMWHLCPVFIQAQCLRHVNHIFIYLNFFATITEHSSILLRPPPPKHVLRPPTATPNTGSKAQPGGG